jgi:TIR domain
MSRPPLFVSYSHLEDEFALQLAADLRAHGVSLWMDRLDAAIRTGDKWRREIEQAIGGRGDPGAPPPAELGETGELARLDITQVLDCSSGPLHHMHFVRVAVVCRDQAGGAFRRAVAEMHKADVFQELRGKDGPFP